MTRLSIAIVVLLAGLLTADRLTPSAAAATAPPLYGPGGVLAMHVRFFAALDEGDMKTVASILAESPAGLTWSLDETGGEWGEPRGFQAFLVDHQDEPRSCDKKSQALKWLQVWSQGTVEAGGRRETRITDGWMDCPSGALSYAVLEFERSTTAGDRVDVRRYRSTSLVSHTKAGWKLWHLHVSPAS